MARPPLAPRAPPPGPDRIGLGETDAGPDEAPPPVEDPGVVTSIAPADGITVVDDDHIQGLDGFVREAAEQVKPRRVISVRSTAPPRDFARSRRDDPDLPGSSWLEIEAYGTTRSLDAWWEAALLAGRIRRMAWAAQTRIPFGYQLILVDDQGRRTPYDQQTIGAPIDDAPPGTPATESVSALEQRVLATGLDVGRVELRGSDRVVAVTAVASDDCDLADLGRTIGAIVAHNRTSTDWLVLIADRNGQIVAGAGASIVTGAGSSLPLLDE